jgi:hypothetical protein
VARWLLDSPLDIPGMNHERNILDVIEQGLAALSEV